MPSSGLDALRALVDVYPGVEREDEMVAAFDFCAFGKGGAAPSIDTAMHGLVEAAHVDHLHPDAGIAFATAADGEALTGECFGGRVAWVPWRRPGFQLGLDIAAIRREHPEAVGVILGGHGITAWGGHERRVRGRAPWRSSQRRRSSSTSRVNRSRSARRSSSRCRRPNAARGPRHSPRMSAASRPRISHSLATTATTLRSWTS